MCRLNGNKSCKLQLYGASSFPPNVNTSDHLTHCKALAQPTCEKRANTELLFWEAWVRRRLLAACCKIQTRPSPHPPTTTTTGSSLQLNIQPAYCTYTKAFHWVCLCVCVTHRWVLVLSEWNVWLQITVDCSDFGRRLDPSMGRNKEILSSPTASIKPFTLIPSVIKDWRRKCWR